MPSVIRTGMRYRRIALEKIRRGSEKEGIEPLVFQVIPGTLRKSRVKRKLGLLEIAREQVEFSKKVFISHNLKRTVARGE